MGYGPRSALRGRIGRWDRRDPHRPKALARGNRESGRMNFFTIHLAGGYNTRTGPFREIEPHVPSVRIVYRSDDSITQDYRGLGVFPDIPVYNLVKTGTDTTEGLKKTVGRKSSLSSVRKRLCY
jgi:hypothetical protein